MPKAYFYSSPGRLDSRRAEINFEFHSLARLSAGFVFAFAELNMNFKEENIFCIVYLENIINHSWLYWDFSTDLK
jgi:hypothetical protein